MMIEFMNMMMIMIINKYTSLIIPNFIKVAPNSTLSTIDNNLVEQWYCYYHEEYEEDDIKVPRYLGPNGWQRTCYYWNSEENMFRTFYTFGQIHLPMTCDEYQNTLSQRNRYHENPFK